MSRSARLTRGPPSEYWPSLPSLLTTRWNGNDLGRPVMFVALFAGISLVLLSFSSRVAERYLFSANYLIGAAGAVVAYRTWPIVRRAFDRIDTRVPALPAMLWTALIVLRLAFGSWLPRVQLR